jgi:hypothetical protein
MLPLRIRKRIARREARRLTKDQGSWLQDIVSGVVVIFCIGVFLFWLEYLLGGAA